MGDFLLLASLLTIQLIFPLKASALEPIFQQGGQFCDRNSPYQDRSSPGCYVTQGSTSTYNIYIPQLPRGNDPNVSQTCFAVSRPQTITQISPSQPGYQLVSESAPTFVSTRLTQWPWDIPDEEDYKNLTLNGKIEHLFADTFGLQGTTRTPTQVSPQTIVDQYGPLEKLQPLIFQVKDRVDYCLKLETKQIFDETINYSLNGVDKTAPLSQICKAIPPDLRHLTNIPQALQTWYHDDPDMAQAFRQITPYVQADQVAWMVIYMYEYEYNPIDAKPTLKPIPTDQAIVKLNLAGLSRYTQAQQRLSDIIVPQDLQSDTPLPSGFPITSAAQLEQVKQQVFQAMKTLGYESPQECNLPKPVGEFQPGPPVAEGILKRFIRAISELFSEGLGNSDATLTTNFVGRCAPDDWQKTSPETWQCTTLVQAVANVYLLNPTYLKDTCDDLYLSNSGYLRAHFPQTLIDQKDSDVPQPTPVPLLPFFNVIGSTVSSPDHPNDPNGKVDLPSSCQGEIARAQSLSFLGKAVRPIDFKIIPRQNILSVYASKTSGVLSGIVSFFQNLFTSTP